ncbi:MAG: SDR family NAD(P)-dependent oxidoreductase, partial [Actinomycetota bacterium]
AQEGARLAIASRSAEPLQITAKEAEASGVEVAAWPVDVTDADAVQGLVGDVLERFGRIEGVVNTVGVSERTAGILEQDDDAWRLHFDSVLMSGVRVCRAVVPGMRERGAGAIVNVSAMSIRHFIPALAHYSAMKIALAHFTRNLAREFAREGIRANAVLPGMIASEPVRARVERAMREKGLTEQEYFEDANARHGGLTFADRLGTPEEVAAVVAFLLSDRASYVNGAWVNVDGGSHG